MLSQKMSRLGRQIDEPTMSDKTLVLNVEDLISLCFGTPATNVVNFKVMQTVLHHLARQMRLLEQEVEIRFDEEDEKLAELQKLAEAKSHAKDTDKGESKKGESTDESHAAGKGRKRDKHSKKGEGGDDTSSFDESHDGKRKHKRTGTADDGADESSKGKKKGKSAKGTMTGHSPSLDDSDEDEKMGKKKGTKIKKGGDTKGEIGEDLAESEATGGKMDKKSHGLLSSKGSHGETDEKSKDASSSKTTDGTHTRSGMGMTVSEVTRTGKKGSKETILVVEKGPTTRDSRMRVGSIEVITQAQFEVLKADVHRLMQKTGFMEKPKMPEDEQLKEDLAKGTATLPATMDGMQVKARVKAAEERMTKMAALLTQLALAGAFPPEMADMVVELQEEHQQLARVMTEGAEAAGTQTSRGETPATSHKSVGLDEESKLSAKSSWMKAALDARISIVSIKSTMGKPPKQVITQADMLEAIEEMRNEMVSKMEHLTSKATEAAEEAKRLANSIEEKLEVALDVDQRVDVLNSLTDDYAEQLSGFDNGLTTQLQSFYEQMDLMEKGFKEGFENLEAISKAESVAMVELRQCHKKMDTLLGRTMNQHAKLIASQQRLTEELKNLLEAVEVLRDEKADREELQDAFRDKADKNRLKMLLNAEAFKNTRNELISRLDTCYEKFEKQDSVWLRALQDLSDISNQKAEIIQYWELRDYVEDNLEAVREALCELEIMLGEPKASILTRELTGEKQQLRKSPMTMEKTHKESQSMPPAPVARKLPGQPAKVADEPCLQDILVLKGPQQEKRHICNRWVGGSHTRVTENTTRERPKLLQYEKIPTKSYWKYGSDGRLYMMEEELQPCLECNQLPKEEPCQVGTPPLVELGGGDQGPVEKDLDMKETPTIVSDVRNVTKF